MTEAEAKKKILADNGVNVAAPSAGLKADLAGVGETMLADWLRETGDEGKAVIGAFRNLRRLSLARSDGRRFPFGVPVRVDLN